MQPANFNWFYRPQTEFIYDQNDKLLVNKVCRLEQLQYDFNDVTQTIGLPTVELPVINASQSHFLTNKRKSPKKEAFSKASVDKVADLYLSTRYKPT